MFTARYARSPYIKHTRFVFKGLILEFSASAVVRGKWSAPGPFRPVTVWWRKDSASAWNRIHVQQIAQ
jgi:hypothetical protein